MRALVWLFGAAMVFTGLLGAIVGFGGYYSLTDVVGQRVCLGVGVFSTLLLLWGWGLCNNAESGRLTDVSLTNFDRVRIGASWNECLTLLGTNMRPSATSKNVVDGQVVERKQFFWDNTDGSYAEVIFENERVVSTSQLGLH